MSGLNESTPEFSTGKPFADTSVYVKDARDTQGIRK